MRAMPHYHLRNHDVLFCACQDHISSFGRKKSDHRKQDFVFKIKALKDSEVCAKSHSTYLSSNSSWPTCLKSPIQVSCQTVHCITQWHNGLVGIWSHIEGNVLRVLEAAHCPGEIKPCFPVMMPAFLSGLSCCSSGKMWSILLITKDYQLCCAFPFTNKRTNDVILVSFKRRLDCVLN